MFSINLIFINQSKNNIAILSKKNYNKILVIAICLKIKVVVILIGVLIPTFSNTRSLAASLLLRATAAFSAARSPLVFSNSD